MIQIISDYTKLGYDFSFFRGESCEYLHIRLSKIIGDKLFNADAIIREEEKLKDDDFISSLNDLISNIEKHVSDI